ncbi:MAG: SPOR domain-containing protein [Flavobacteriales bacterium]
MINIQEHIIELVLNYQTVIIPKLGSFTKTSEFKCNDNHEFTKEEYLEFSQNSRLDDGMLYKYVSLKENISLSESQNLVDEYISSIKVAVFNQKNFSLLPLGKFELSPKDQISFKHEINFQLFPENYGLNDFSKQPIIRKTEIKIEETNKNNRKMYWAVACLVPLLSFSIYLGLNRESKQQNAVPVTAGLSEISDLENAVTPDFIDLSSIEEISFESIEEMESEEEVLVFETKKVKTEIAKATPKKAYQIIIGVFGEKKNAEKLARSIKNMSKSVVISPYKKMHKVSTEIYTSKYKATKDLQTIRKNHPSAWLLKVK